MNKKKDRADCLSIVIGAAVGAGGSMITALLLSALSAELVSRAILSEDSFDTVTAAILILTAFCGALLAVSITGHHRLPVCLVTGGIYYLMLLSCTALFYGGVYRAVGVTALTVLGGCGAVALLGLNDGRKRRAYRHPKNRNWKIVQN